MRFESTRSIRTAFELEASSRGLRLAAGSALLLATLSCVSDSDRVATIDRSAQAELPPELPQPTHGREALAYRMLALTGGSGTYDPAALLAASEQRETMAVSAAQQAGGVSPATWIDRGPSNAGGRTRAFLVHPNNPQILWAGAASGGLWKSTNGGTSWRLIDDFLPTLEIYSLAMDPNDSQVLYAGTGEVTGGVGIFKSLDGGETWDLLPSTLNRDFRFVRRIAIDPNNSQTLLAAVYHDFRGIQRSTDGGQTWQAVLPIPGASQAAFDPADSTRAIAAGLSFTQSLGFFWTSFYSTDGGRTWRESSGLPATGPFDRVEMAYAPSNTDIVYAQVAQNPSRIYRSTDGGRTFNLRTTVDNIALDYMNTVWVSPTDPDFVIVAGQTAWRSLDGGLTFEGPVNGGCLDQSLDAIGHVDIHSFHPHPGYDGAGNRRVWMTTDGGIYRTNDIRTADCDQGWVGLNQGYQTTQFYSVAGGPEGLVIGGTQDQGTLRVLPDSNQALKIAPGDGGVVQIDVSDTRFVFGAFQFLAAFRSRDRGETIEVIVDGLADHSDPARTNFIAPSSLDPQNPAVLYAGGLSMWRARGVRARQTPTWHEIRAPGSERIYHFSIAETNPDVLWLGQNDGKIYRTFNASAQSPVWFPVEDNAGLNQLPDRVPTRVQVSRHDENTAYVTFGGFHPDNLWRTRDGGQTWQDISRDLPAAPKEAFVEHPLFPDWLYVGTNVGLFTSTDGGSTWYPENGAPANVLVRDLQFVQDTTKLVLGTYGRGFHVADTPGGDCSTADSALCVTQGRFDVRVSWKDFRGNRGFGHADSITSDTGTFWFFDDTNTEFVVKVLDACGFNDRFWVFAAGLTNVETTVEVTDTLTGATRRYRNPLGSTFQPIQDTDAFATCGARAASPAAERRLANLQRSADWQTPAKTNRPTAAANSSQGSCTSSATALCLADGRFRVEATYDDRQGTGAARAVELSSDTGYLWFFNEDNVELLVKVLDGCGISNTYWVFAGGLTNVEVDLTVTDTLSGQTSTYRNPFGSPFLPIQDFETFTGCS